MAESRRIALAAPIWHDPPRFAIGGQAGQTAGDVKVYEWSKEVSPITGLGYLALGIADTPASGDADDRVPNGRRARQGHGMGAPSGT